MEFEKKMIDSLSKAKAAKKELPKPASGLSLGLPTQRVKAGKSSVVVEDDFDGSDVAFKFGFIGTGQGGARLASAFYGLGYRRVALFNTVDKDWKGLPEGILRLSADVGGAAKDAKVGKAAAEKCREEIYEMLERAWGLDVDYGLICVGGGGGTGSGSASVLVDVARQYLKDKNKDGKIGVILSLPSPSEGQQVARNAVTCVRQILSQGCSPILLIDNDKINSVYQPSLMELYPTANQLISYMLHAFNVLAEADTHLTTFDKAELAHVLGSGLITVGAIEFSDKLQSPADVTSAIRDQLPNVLATVDLKTGDKAACVFLGCEKTLSTLGLDFFEAGYGQIQRLMADGAVVHRGVYVQADPGLRAMVMVGGLSTPYTALQRLAEVAKLDKSAMQSTGLLDFLGLSD